ATHRHLERTEHALGEIARGRRHFGHTDVPTRIVDECHVRERAADIDSDAPSHIAVPITAFIVDWMARSGSGSFGVRAPPRAAQNGGHAHDPCPSSDRKSTRMNYSTQFNS